MPTIIISKKVFERLVGKKLPIDKLKNRISYLGTDLEGIEGDEITVEIFPNRPDLLSVQGFARAFSSFIGVKTGLRNYKVKSSGHKVMIDHSVSSVRPFTACAIIKNLTFDDEKIKEVIDLQEKLHITFGRQRKKVAIGIYPFEKIKPPIRFIARKPSEIKFRPLEAQQEMSALQILSRHPAGRDYGYLLEGLDKFPIFIDSNNQILSMPPIINSHITGKITEQTNEVFIECSGFDFEVLKKCLNMIVTALADISGQIYSMQLEYPDRNWVTPDLTPSQMKLDVNYVNKVLGLELKETEVKKLLERMGFGYRKKKVLVPAYRADVLHQIDLIEDIAIAYGFDNFKALIPKVATIGQEDYFEIFKNKIKETLIGVGLIETITYNLSNAEFQNKKMNYNTELIELRNSISKEYNVLRAWTLPSLLEVLSHNKHNDYPQKIFSIGTVFSKDSSTETGILERESLAIALIDEKTNYTSMRQVLDYLLRLLGLEYEITEAEHSSFIPGRIGSVIVKNKKLGLIGEISPQVITNWSLEMPVVALELDLNELFSFF